MSAESLRRSKSLTAIDAAHAMRRRGRSNESKEKKIESKHHVNESKVSGPRNHKAVAESKRGDHAREGHAPVAQTKSLSISVAGNGMEVKGPRIHKKTSQRGAKLSPRARIRNKMTLTLNFSKLNLNAAGPPSHSGGELVPVSPMETGGRDSSREDIRLESDDTDSSFYTPRDDSGGRWMVGPEGITEMPQSALEKIHNVVRPISAVGKSTASNARSKSEDFVRLRKLGGGAGGTVHLAIHKKHLQLVALKTIDYTKADTQQQRRQEIERELTILHPNFVPLGKPNLKPADYCDQLVSFHGAYTTERFITIILEFMPLGSLDDCLKRGMPVEDMALRLVARRVLQGLNYLHERDVLHRDIKPGNILIGRNGKVKIADFGLAVKVKNYREHNLNVSMKGTKQFMSFERLDHDLPPDQYSFASDVWSLGITLYCLALGKKAPFEKLGNNHFSLREHLLTHSVMPDLRTHKTHSTDLCDFVEQCTRKDPKQRPTVKKLLRHPLVDKKSIDIRQVHFWVQPRMKRKPEKQLASIVEAIAASFTKDKQAEKAEQSRSRRASSLALPPLRKGSDSANDASFSSDDDSDGVGGGGGGAASKETKKGSAEKKGLRTRRQSATAILTSPRRGAPRVSLPPVSRLRRSSTTKDVLAGSGGRHRPHSAEPSRQYFTKNRPYKGAVETLARQLGVPVVQAWSMFEALMPGWAPRPTVKKESSRRGFDASHLPDLSSKHGNLTPLGSTRDRLSGDSEGFNKRVPLSMSVGAGLSSPQHADRAIIKPLKSSSSSSALLEHRTPGLEGLTAQPDDSNLASSLGARSVVEVDSFDDSFASSDPNIGGPALSPILHYANNPSSDSSGSDSDSSSDGFGSSSIDSLDEYKSGNSSFSSDEDDAVYMNV